MDDDLELSESGSPIYRHQPRISDWAVPEHGGVHLEAIQDHLARHIGPVEMVFHELLSDLVHLDVLFIRATAERPYHVLVTSGVSDRRMAVPEEMESFARAELMIALPEDWQLTQKAFKDEANYWPVRWLKQIGRLPHEYDTWIGWGHTIPNGDPPVPIADTQSVGVMLSPPYWLPPEFFELQVSGDESIQFYNLVPLYAEEMDFKLKRGAEALEEQLEKREVGFVLDPTRPNVAKKKGWFS